MQNRVSVKVNSDSLHISNRNVITGDIYFSIEDQFFPEEGWNDFLVVILSWWGKTISTLSSSGNGTTIELAFMDGPFYVKCTKESESTVVMDFIREGSIGQEIKLTRKETIYDLKSMITYAGNKILGELTNRHWITDEVRELEKVLRG